MKYIRDFSQYGIYKAVMLSNLVLNCDSNIFRQNKGKWRSADVPCATKARNLGVTFDCDLTMTSHENSICRHVSLALRKISRARKYISQSSTERLVHAFISSKLDYCNSLLYGLPSTEVQKLQRIQNIAARLVVKAKRTDHTSPILRQLHWLPVSERISFKILLLTYYKAINGCAPSYMKNLLSHYQPRRNLRSILPNW